MPRRGIGFWALQVPGWILLLYLVYAQGIPAFDYDLGVAMGTQEPAENVTEVGTAIWWGFAFADLVFYIPLLAIGLAGHLAAKAWGGVALAAALGITAYWPIVALAIVGAGRGGMEPVEGTGILGRPATHHGLGRVGTLARDGGTPPPGAIGGRKPQSYSFFRSLQVIGVSGTGAVNWPYR